MTSTEKEAMKRFARVGGNGGGRGDAHCACAAQGQVA